MKGIKIYWQAIKYFIINVLLGAWKKQKGGKK